MSLSFWCLFSLFLELLECISMQVAIIAGAELHSTHLKMALGQFTQITLDHALRKLTMDINAHQRLMAFLCTVGIQLTMISAWKKMVFIAILRFNLACLHLITFLRRFLLSFK